MTMSAPHAAELLTGEPVPDDADHAELAHLVGVAQVVELVGSNICTGTKLAVQEQNHTRLNRAVQPAGDRRDRLNDGHRWNRARVLGHPTLRL